MAAHIHKLEDCLTAAMELGNFTDDGYDQPWESESYSSTDSFYFDEFATSDASTLPIPATSNPATFKLFLSSPEQYKRGPAL